MPFRCSARQRRHVRNVDPQRLPFQSPLAQLAEDEVRERVRHAGRVRHRAAHRRHPRAPTRLRQPRAIQLMVPSSRAEVPQHGIVITEQKAEPDVLVTLPRADRRTRHVPEIVRVEQQQGSQIRLPEHRLRTLETMRPQPTEIDPLLPVDRHRRTPRRNAHLSPPLVRVFSDSAQPGGMRQHVGHGERRLHRPRRDGRRHRRPPARRRSRRARLEPHAVEGGAARRARPRLVRQPPRGRRALGRRLHDGHERRRPRRRPRRRGRAARRSRLREGLRRHEHRQPRCQPAGRGASPQARRRDAGRAGVGERRDARGGAALGDGRR